MLLLYYHNFVFFSRRSHITRVSVVFFHNISTQPLARASSDECIFSPPALIIIFRTPIVANARWLQYFLILHMYLQGVPFITNRRYSRVRFYDVNSISIYYSGSFVFFYFNTIFNRLSNSTSYTLKLVYSIRFLFENINSLILNTDLNRTVLIPYSQYRKLSV